MQTRKKKRRVSSLTVERERMRLSLKHFLGEGLLLNQDKVPSSFILFQGSLNQQLLIGAIKS